MTIYQQPDPLSLSGNIKDIILTDATDKVVFRLSVGSTLILEHIYYPDEEHRIVIDIRRFVEEQLSFSLTYSTNPWEQPLLARSFSFTAGNLAEQTFTAIRTGIDHPGETAANWLRSNFLTWQPTVKHVTYSTPELLTYYAASACKVRIKVYYSDGTSEMLTAITLTAGVWTIPVSYAVIASRLGLTSQEALQQAEQLPGAYDVWIEDTSGNRLTYVQRYVAGNTRENEQWILFENSLGGVDCFRAYGQGSLETEHEHQLTDVDDETDEYRVDTVRRIRKSTGWMNMAERRWMLDFFPSRHRWICEDGVFRSIVLTEDSATYTLDNMPAEFEFTFRYTTNLAYLNVPRLLVPPSVLNITAPDLQSFSLPPRLAEFPRLDPSEGALIPVQSPYSDHWAAISVADLISGTSADISRLERMINAEANTRRDADQTISAALEQETERATNIEEQIATALEQEIERATESERIIQASLDDMFTKDTSTIPARIRANYSLYTNGHLLGMAGVAAGGITDPSSSGGGGTTDHSELDNLGFDESGHKGFQRLIDATHKLAYSLISGTPTSLPASDVYPWAKAATKPSYAFTEITGTASSSQIPTLAISKISGLQGALDGKVPVTRTVNGHALSDNVTISKGDIGLGNVENTKLSTWAGSTNLTILGTIATGVWQGTPVADTYIASAATWNAKQDKIADVADTPQDYKYVSAVSQTNGKIAVTHTDFPIATTEHIGMVSILAQSFAGNKTFTGFVHSDADVIGQTGVAAGGITDPTSSGGGGVTNYNDLDDRPLINGEVLIGGESISLQPTISDLATIRADASAGKTASDNLALHLADTNNPHSVTKTQIGLGNVEDKSSATIRSEITANDIPSLDASKITTGTFADERIASAATWNAKYDKPGTGIPLADLAAGVQASLGKADSAVQKTDVNLVTGSDSVNDNFSLKFTVKDVTKTLVGIRLTGDTLVPAIVRNVVRDAAGDWSCGLGTIQVDGSGKFTIGAVGTYALGVQNGLTYAYLGCNAYNGLNLRITTSALTWGTDTLWHAGNSNNATVDWNARNLTLAGYISGATTIEASGRIHTTAQVVGDSGVAAGGITDPTSSGGGGGGSVDAVKVNGVTYNPDASGVVTLPNYYNKTESDNKYATKTALQTTNIAVGALDTRLTADEANISGMSSDINALKGYFTDGSATNALKLGGKFASSYALKTDIPDVSGFLTKATADTLYAPISHTHSQYLPLTGGTMTGIISYNNGGSWISARDHCAVKTTRTSGQGSDWHPVVGLKTSAGFWSFGSVGGETLCFSHDTDADYSASRNTNIRIDMPLKAGTIALTSDIPSMSDYLSKSQGGQVTGGLWASGGLTVGTSCSLTCNLTPAGTIDIGDSSNTFRYGYISHLIGSEIRCVGTAASIALSFSNPDRTSRWMSITTGGRVGIGRTATGSYLLDVAGSFNADSGYINGNAIIHSGNIGSQSVAYASSAGNASSSGSTNALLNVGYGSGNFTWFQTSGDFDGNTGWCHYLISNHGDGASYYHYTIGLPFWGVPIYRRQTGSTSAVTSWYKFITDENISSQSVNYANSAGYASSAGNADTVDSEHASAFAHRQTWNNMIHSGNEYTYAAPGYSGIIWHNWRTASGGVDGNITDYYMGNGAGGYAYVDARGFIKSGSSDSYVLLGGGGHKAVSDFATASQLGSYLLLSGGTMTGQFNTRNNAVGINFRGYSSSSWDSWCAHETTGNEALVFGTQNAVTAIMFVNGESYGNVSSSRFQSLTPGLSIVNNSVLIGYSYTSSPSYKLAVNGSFNAASGYINGNTIYHSGNLTAATLGAMTQSAADARYWRPDVARLASGTLSLQGGLVMLSNITTSGTNDIGTSSDRFRSVYANIVNVGSRIEKGGYYFRRYLGVYGGSQDLPGSSVAETGDYAIVQVYTNTWIFVVYAILGGRTGWWQVGGTNITPFG